MTPKTACIIRAIILTVLAVGIYFEAGFFSMTGFLVVWLALELRKPRRQPQRPPSILVVGNLPTTRHQRKPMSYPIEKYLN